METSKDNIHHFPARELVAAKQEAESLLYIRVLMLLLTIACLYLNTIPLTVASSQKMLKLRAEAAKIVCVWVCVCVIIT